MRRTLKLVSQGADTIHTIVALVTSGLNLLTMSAQFSTAWYSTMPVDNHNARNAIVTQKNLE